MIHGWHVPEPQAMGEVSRLTTPPAGGTDDVAYGGPTHGYVGRDEIAQPPPCFQR
jgi:hypothetical protein